MRIIVSQGRYRRPKKGNIRLLMRRFTKASKEVWHFLPEDDIEMVARVQRFDNVIADIKQAFSRISGSRPYNKGEAALLDKVRCFIVESELVLRNLENIASSELFKGIRNPYCEALRIAKVVK